MEQQIQARQAPSIEAGSNQSRLQLGELTPNLEHASLSYAERPYQLDRAKSITPDFHRHRKIFPAQSVDRGKSNSAVFDHHPEIGRLSLFRVIGKYYGVSQIEGGFSVERVCFIRSKR